jgi:Domain of unknown function (DUF6766)
MRSRASREKPVQWREPWIHAHSFSVAFLLMFMVFFILHLVYGTAAYNEFAVQIHQPKMSIRAYLLSSTCWFQIFQTWQAEFFAIGMFVVLSIFLRERGSPESKPEEASNEQTGTGENQPA